MINTNPIFVSIMYHRDTHDFKKGESITMMRRFESFEAADAWAEDINRNRLSYQSWHVTNIYQRVPGPHGHSFVCFDISKIWDTYEVRSRNVPRWGIARSLQIFLEREINNRMRVIYAKVRKGLDPSRERAEVEALWSQIADWGY